MDTLRQEKVDVSRLRLSDMYQTTLAFVHLDESGDRSFSFYRRQGADTMLRTEPADFKAVEQSRVFFFSSVMMTESPARETSFALAAHAKERGVVTVFDPNLRLNLWAGEAEARDCILRAMPFADIVKVSEEELVFLTGETELRRGAAVLYARFPMKALLCTLGAKGRPGPGRGRDHCPGTGCPSKPSTRRRQGIPLPGDSLPACWRKGRISPPSPERRSPVYWILRTRSGL